MKRPVSVVCIGQREIRTKFRSEMLRGRNRLTDWRRLETNNTRITRRSGKNLSSTLLSL
jgi:hypothetical protein